jgi:cation transport protein ChaC
MGEGRWVFGYGSLMWRPGFAFVERQAAVLHGRRRAFCIYSVHHRGVPGRPGLVLGLAPGG